MGADAGGRAVFLDRDGTINPTAFSDVSGGLADGMTFPPPLVPECVPVNCEGCCQPRGGGPVRCEGDVCRLDPSGFSASTYPFDTAPRN